jgi:hypothetical protein
MKFVVLLTTPRKPARDRGQRLAHQVEDRDAVHHRALEQELAAGARRRSRQRSIGERHRSFVGGDDVRAAGQRSADMARGRLPAQHISVVVSTTTRRPCVRRRGSSRAHRPGTARWTTPRPCVRHIGIRGAGGRGDHPRGDTVVVRQRPALLGQQRHESPRHVSVADDHEIERRHCGLRIADCGLMWSDCGLRIGSRRTRH